MNTEGQAAVLDDALQSALEKLGLAPSAFLAWAKRHTPKPPKVPRTYLYQAPNYTPSRRKFKPSGRTAQIVVAIKNGAVTSPELARRLGINRSIMSVTLYKLADGGVICRGRGRHPICWRIAPEASP